ncbi:GNAT family N-acetyltransferase [Hymenobacter siberiensis]|uniref:GNAT family N-acetyltransferase n=1 Tax=Hymenobacter siberiensis TaxID=2848396 RepID=UPI001C1E0128|nr:GNAT family N-acetyltransferase [Hymenobacter siberiensis]
MSSVLELLPWDTEFLGYKVGRLQPTDSTLVTVNELIGEARLQGFHLLYWAADPTDVTAAHTALAIGAYLADQKVTYAMPVKAGVTQQLGQGIEVAVELSAQLVSLALQSGHHSRYQNDARFAPDVFLRLYTRWIENSVNGKLAREVLVYRADRSGEELGMITLNVKNTRADIGLLAVDERTRGQEIGTRLIDAAHQRSHAWGVEVLQVVTQVTNSGACRFYERCGFRTDSIVHIYHIWLP